MKKGGRMVVKSMRIAAEDWAKIEAVAASSGTTASEWVRRVSLLQLTLVGAHLSATNVPPVSSVKVRSSLAEELAKREGGQGAPSA